MSDTAVAAIPLRRFDESLPMALLRARESVLRSFRPLLAEHDLTEQQWRVLRVLDDADAPMSVGHVADATSLLGPSLSRMLTSMEQRKLLERVTGSDARRSEISICAAGRSLVAEVAPAIEAAYGVIDSRLDDGDLDELY
ncbi:MAG: homoprotocatechuate degradation operon regulator HpaR, partial [Ilumatobacter sp.]